MTKPCAKRPIRYLRCTRALLVAVALLQWGCTILLPLDVQDGWRRLEVDERIAVRDIEGNELELTILEISSGAVRGVIHPPRRPLRNRGSAPRVSSNGVESREEIVIAREDIVELRVRQFSPGRTAAVVGAAVLLGYSISQLPAWPPPP